MLIRGCNRLQHDLPVHQSQRMIFRVHHHQPFAPLGQHSLVVPPADWQPGDDVIVPTADSCGVAKERMDNKEEEMHCYDWFLCTKKLDKEMVFKTILKK